MLSVLKHRFFPIGSFERVKVQVMLEIISLISMKTHEWYNLLESEAGFYLSGQVVGIRVAKILSFCQENRVLASTCKQ